MDMEIKKSLEDYNSKIKRVLITEEEIRTATKALGKQISDSYDGRPILLVSILKGAFVFLADLAREIPGAIFYPTLPEVSAALRELAQPGDLILTVGAGDIYAAGEKLVK